MWTVTTYPILNDGGQPFAFEVENIYLTLSKAAAVLRSVQGVSDIQQRGLFRRPMDVHLRFRYCGEPFVVWEPYGDSSRYWIGPDEPAQLHPDIGALQTAFDLYRPPFLLRALGNLITLKFLGRQK